MRQTRRESNVSLGCLSVCLAYTWPLTWAGMMAGAGSSFIACEPWPSECTRRTTNEDHFRLGWDA